MRSFDVVVAGASAAGTLPPSAGFSVGHGGTSTWARSTQTGKQGKASKQVRNRNRNQPTAAGAGGCEAKFRG